MSADFLLHMCNNPVAPLQNGQPRLSRLGVVLIETLWTVFILIVYSVHYYQLLLMTTVLPYTVFPQAPWHRRHARNRADSIRHTRMRTYDLRVRFTVSTQM